MTNPPYYTRGFVYFLTYPVNLFFEYYSPKASHMGPTLPDQLNKFYACFEANNNKAQAPLPSPSKQALQVTAAQVKKSFH